MMLISLEFHQAVLSATVLPIVVGWLFSVSAYPSSYHRSLYNLFQNAGSSISIAETITISPSLKSLVVTSAEIDTVIYEFSKYHAQRDVTDELEGFCQRDCVKILWEWSSSGSRKTLIMVRTPSHTKATQAVENLYETYAKLGDAFFLDSDESKISESWSGAVNFPHNRFRHIVARTQGPIFIFLIHQYSPKNFVVDVDPGGHIQALEDIVNIQIEKLAKGGYEP